MFKVIVESDIGPKLNKLAEGQQVLLETLAPKNRVEELEDEVSFLKSLIRNRLSVCTVNRLRS